MGYPVKIDANDDHTRRVVRGVVITDDNFEQGMAGWGQLVTPQTGKMWAPASRIERGGQWRLTLRMPTTAMTSPLQGAMLIKRMSTIHGDGKYLVEFFGAHVENAISDSTRLRWINFGLDVVNAAGDRRFFALRFLNYDETGATQPQKFQLRMGATFFDIPGGSIPLMTNTNENKVMPNYISFVVDLATGTYQGVRVNNQLKFGLLAETPNGDAVAAGVVEAEAPLTTFDDGCNPFIEGVNRSTAMRQATTIGIIRHRMTYLGA